LRGAPTACPRKVGFNEPCPVRIAVSGDCTEQGQGILPIY
jgi:hypothetical protein